MVGTYEMAAVVRLAAVVAEEAQRVVLGDVLGVVLDELLGALPERGDRVNVLVQAQHERVLLLVLGHEAEGVVVHVAEELDAGLDAPVVLVVEHERLVEEEARLEAAHVAVADGVAVDDFALLHVGAHALRLVLVDPLGEGPVLGGDEAVVGVARDEPRRDLLEVLVEGLVVEEDPVVVVTLVEAVLDLLDRRGDVPHVVVARQRHEGRVHPGAGRRAHQVAPAGVRGAHGHGVLGGVVGLADREGLRGPLLGRDGLGGPGIALAAMVMVRSGDVGGVLSSIIRRLRDEVEDDYTLDSPRKLPGQK